MMPEASRSQRAAYALNKFLGLSQEAIAERVGVAFSRVNAWINAKSQPRAKHAKAVEAVLKAESVGGGDKRSLLRSCVARLHVQYGSPHLSNKGNALDELFFILLSLKTSHYTYEDTYRAFRAAFYPWRKLLDVEPEDVERHIKRGGLGSLKARAFVDIARRLKADLGEVSLSKLKALSINDAQTYLLSLPGVGVKTARCVLMYALGRDTLPVDTHTYRVGVRLGLIETSRGTGDVHRQFDEIMMPGFAYPLHTNFVAHGRKLCRETAPACPECILKDLCAHGRQVLRDATTVSVAKLRSNVRSIGEPERPTAIDIYAGCGGLSVGLKDSGFDLKYALDWDKNSCATHEANFAETVVQCQDVRAVEGSDIKRVVGRRLDLVAGGPNCQGVSQRGLRNPHDPRNFMLSEFVRLVADLQPRAFVMENVPGLAHRHNFAFLRSMFETFEGVGYRCAADVLLAADYGVPQLRYRFFLIGMRDQMPASLPAPTHGPSLGGYFARRYVNVWEGIGDLPSVESDRQADTPLPYAKDADNDFLRYAREGSTEVHNHVCSATAEINLKRAAHIPEGGNWKDIPQDVLPPRLFTCRMTDHSTTYARLRRDQPAFTITSLFGNITAGAFTHPISNRALTVREGARLQSFRDSFHFAGARNTQYRQIGNAIPPLLARAVGSHVLALLRGERVAGMPPRINSTVLADQRAWDALPILTPRFKPLLGTGTRWPKGWGPEPRSYKDMLDDNYSLRPEFVPEYARSERRKLAPVGADDE